MSESQTKYSEERSSRFKHYPESICLFEPRQKYVLLSFEWNSEKKLIVRTGLQGCQHADIVSLANKEIERESFQPHHNMGWVKYFPGFELKCLGGGWIDLKKTETGFELVLNGSSYGYGKADHAVAAEIMKNEMESIEFPFEVTVSIEQ